MHQKSVGSIDIASQQRANTSIAGDNLTPVGTTESPRLKTLSLETTTKFIFVL